MSFFPRLIYRSVLFFALCTAIYPSNHYVDKNASGQNNGTSWTNAWQSFSAINWSSINPGDVVYISGGSDSTFYYEQLNIAATGTPDHLITIRAGLDAGHNGRVIIDAQGTRSHAILVAGGSSSGYLNIVKLEGRRSTGHGTFGFLSGSSGQNIHNVYIDSYRITDFFGHGAIFANGNSSSGQVPYWQATSYTDGLYIRWCYLKSKHQYPASASAPDVIFVQSSTN